MTADRLASQLDALARAADLVDGRSDVGQARRVAEQANSRLAFTEGQTVVALAGATGSGKSSLFNAVSGTTLAEPGILRPTTSETLAASFNTDANELLTWLGINRRFAVRTANEAMHGLVLLDLPDHDSIERTHREEVDRLVQVVDQLIWVVDPQKYADAALHLDFLRPLAGHGAVACLALNHADQLGFDDRQRCLHDLRRILDEEGLTDVPVIATSAVTGEGVMGLRTDIARLVQSRTAAVWRLRSDVQRAAADLATQLGPAAGETLTGVTVTRVRGVLAEAAGIDRVVTAVTEATRNRGRIATGWPALSWMGLLRPDPLKQLSTGSTQNGSKGWLGLPKRAALQRSPVAGAVRIAGKEAATNLPESWRDVVLAMGSANVDRVSDALGQAVAQTDLRPPVVKWWSVMRFFQWLVFLTLIAGVAWTIIGIVMGTFSLWSLPSALIAGGVAGGIALSLLGRVLNAFTARSAGRTAERVLMTAVNEVMETEILDPIRVEINRHDEAVRLLRPLV